VTDPEAEAVGVDVGGTKVAAMRVHGDGRIIDQCQVDTPSRDADGAVEALLEAARRMMGEQVQAVGIGAAGLVDFAAGVLRYAPNIAWREVRIAERVSQEFGRPCLLDNDANVAAWAEFRFGAGRGTTEMLLVTVGTGIGGGIVSGGRMFRGAHGFAADIGHIIVEPGGPLCGCGNFGCWEQVASGRAIQRLGQGVARDHPNSLVAELAGGDPGRVTGPLVTQAAMEGDDVAKSVLAEVGRRLGEGIGGLVNVLDPEVVVVGGGAVEAGDLLLGPAREAFLEAVEAPDHRPEVPIRPAEMGNDAGAVGAAALALDELT
jgi:glucokinase